MKKIKHSQSESNFESYFNKVNSGNETKLILYNNIFNDTLKNKIQTILILMFYFEKDAKLKKREFFSNNNDHKDNFYLVNHDWINEFKNYYHYQTICNKLNNDFRFKYFKYDNIDCKIKDILLKIKDINFGNLKLSEDLSNFEKIKPPIEEKNEVKYYKLSFIIPSKIMNLIKNIINFEENFKSIEIFYKNDDMYIIDQNNIYVGCLNNELLFIPKYIFSYKSTDLTREEKEKLKLFSKEEYIKKNKCDNIFPNSQQLKNQNNEIIGKLIILNNKSNKDRVEGSNHINYEEKKNNVYQKSRNAKISPRIKNNNNTYNAVKNTDIKKEEKENEKIISQLRNENNELKKNNTIKIDEIKKQLREEMHNEIIKENNKLKKELNETKIKLEQLQKESDENKKEIENQKKIFNEKFENLLNYINNKLNDKFIEHEIVHNEIKKDEEKNQNENKHENKNESEYININDMNEEKREEIKFSSGETLRTIENYCPIKTKFKNFHQNNNNKKNFLYMPNLNSNYSKLIFGGNPIISQYKTNQIQNPEIIDENGKKKLYLNIVLKCLNQILGQYFLKDQTIDRIRNYNQFQLSNEFLSYAQNWYKNSKEIDPSSILAIIENTNNNLKNNYNLNNIIATIFHQLHKELKFEQKLNNKDIYIDGLPFENSRERNNFDNFFRNFLKETSIISDGFAGFIEQSVECPVSTNNKSIYIFNIYNYLIFEIQKYKNKYNIANKEIDLNKCLIYYLSDRTFKEEKKSECEICEEKCQKSFISYYFSNPNYLILILDNENENSNEVIKVKFRENLTLKSKLSEDDYNLYAVITQIGLDKQNIVASYKSNKDKDNKWYRYNNKDEELIKDIQKEVIDFEHPLLLLYKKKLKLFENI